MRKLWQQANLLISNQEIALGPWPFTHILNAVVPATVATT
jgi:hypothetical protein